MLQELEKKSVEETMDMGLSVLSEITVFNKYAKFLPKESRRETWQEIVDRNKNMHLKKFPQLTNEIEEAYKLVYDKKVLPSMRSMQFAGKPIDVNPPTIFNCSFLPIDDYRAFGETMFLLLSGTGVGYSVQKHHIEKLPELKKPSVSKTKRFLVGDSVEGWADAIKALMKSYFMGGSTIRFDYSDIRPKGAMLVTAGGKAPGPDPLKGCINQIVSILSRREDGDKLSSTEVHDIICHIADAVLAGGIRRAALIALFSADDENMLKSKSNFTIENWKYALEAGPVDSQGEPVEVYAKHIDDLGNVYYDLEVTVNEPCYGKSIKTLYWVSESDIQKYLTVTIDNIPNGSTLPWYYFQPQRGRANNSAALLRHKLKKSFFMELWKKVEESGSGEPGIYLTNDKDWGTNPCVEIALRPFQFCNLTEINASNITSQEDLNERARVASFIGTLQASYTDFHYLRPIWKKTTEKDALIGVSMTGIASMKLFKYSIEEAVEVVKSTNENIAKLLNINAAARTTCTKPAGTTSLVLGTSSGIHAWHNDYYLRRMRIGKNEALYTYLSIYHPELLEDDIFRPYDTACIVVPQKAPEGAVLRTESAFELLERVKEVSTRWVVNGFRNGQNGHNVSATITVKKDEWKAVGEWMWENRETYNGLSVLPHNEHSYKQAPFEDCTKEEYENKIKSLHSVNLKNVVEMGDTTNLAGELACASGNCEIQ